MTPAGEPPLVLALDVGTSSVRALLFDAAGRPTGHDCEVAYQPRLTPDGGVVFDADRLFELAAGCVRQVSAGAPLAVLAMDSFWHSLMGVDARGRPTTPVITWADTRAAAAARELRRDLSEPEVHARTGCRLHASYWPAKLRWLRQTDPEAFQPTARWLSFGEYFQWRLTGELACSLSMASATGLLDLRRATWDEALLEGLQVTPAQLSPLVDLDARLPGRWLPAIGDGAASNAGSGCLSRDRIALNVGTSSALRLAWTSDGIPPIPAALWCYRLDARRLLLGGALSEGGNLWAWLRSTLRLPGVDAEEQALATMDPDGHGLTVLPFIAGERSPGWADDARLSISGASASTTSMDILRACLEAIAYRLAAILEQLPGREEADVIAGGTAILSSPAWLQIVADVLNRPVRALAAGEATARGTALLALESAGLIASIDSATFDYAARYEPDPARHARYQQAIHRQQRLYERVIAA